MAVLAVVDRGLGKRGVAVIRLQLAQVRVTTAALAILAQKQIVVAVVVLALLAVLQAHPPRLGVLAAMAAQEPHQQFPVYLQLMLAVAVVAQSMGPPELAAQVVVVPVLLLPIMLLVQQPIPAAVAAAQETILIQPA
jgi:hypothetical protein